MVNGYFSFNGQDVLLPSPLLREPLRSVSGHAVQHTFRRLLVVPSSDKNISGVCLTAYPYQRLLNLFNSRTKA